MNKLLLGIIAVTSLASCRAPSDGVTIRPKAIEGTMTRVLQYANAYVLGLDDELERQVRAQDVEACTLFWAQVLNVEASTFDIGAELGGPEGETERLDQLEQEVLESLRRQREEMEVDQQKNSARQKPDA